MFDVLEQQKSDVAVLPIVDLIANYFFFGGNATQV